MSIENGRIELRPIEVTLPESIDEHDRTKIVFAPRSSSADDNRTTNNNSVFSLRNQNTNMFNHVEDDFGLKALEHQIKANSNSKNSLFTIHNKNRLGISSSSSSKRKYSNFLM